MMTFNGWTFWVDKPPPPDEIVECRRIGVDEEENLSFWVKPSLMAPEWNIADVIWRPVTQ